MQQQQHSISACACSDQTLCSRRRTGCNAASSTAASKAKLNRGAKIFIANRARQTTAARLGRATLVYVMMVTPHYYVVDSSRTVGPIFFLWIKCIVISLWSLLRYSWLNPGAAAVGCASFALPLKMHLFFIVKTSIYVYICVKWCDCLRKSGRPNLSRRHGYGINT